MHSDTLIVWDADGLNYGMQDPEMGSDEDLSELLSRTTQPLIYSDYQINIVDENTYELRRGHKLIKIIDADHENEITEAILLDNL